MYIFLFQMCAGLSPPASLIIRPNRTQHFIYKSLSLSCEMQDNHVGWRLRWFTDQGELTECPAGWRSVVGSTCTIVHPHETDSGVYWCQSEFGLRSNPVNVTFHGKFVRQRIPCVLTIVWHTPGNLRNSSRIVIPYSLNPRLYCTGLGVILKLYKTNWLCYAENNFKHRWPSTIIMGIFIFNQNLFW